MGRKEKNLDFENERLEYCKYCYERFLDSRSILDKKAAFISSFNALLITGIFLKIDYLLSICSKTLNDNAQAILIGIALGFLLLSGLFIFISTIAIILSSQIITYKNPFNDKFSNLLFAPDYKEVPEGDSKSLLNFIAQHYAFVTEENMKIIKKKVNKVRIAHTCTYLGISFFSFFLLLLILSTVSKGD